MAQAAPSTEEAKELEQNADKAVDPKPKKQKKKKKKKKKGETIEMTYECMASAEMMVKIFKMEEDRFLKTVFFGQIKEQDDCYVVGDGQSFLFKVISSKVTEDDEHVLDVEWHKKEWDDDEWSTVHMVFTDDDEMDRKCDLEFKQTGIPKTDKHGNPDQPLAIKLFWQNTIFKGLTQMANIGCKEQK